MDNETPRSGMRAADTDRERVTEQLRSAHADGRLDLTEYDKRVQQAWAAQTYGELETLTADLPRAHAAVTEMPGPTNGFAIASLVLGILFFFWGFTSILALIFGYIARKQIRERNERGAGLAVAGIVLGWVGVGLWAIIMILVVLGAIFS